MTDRSEGNMDERLDNISLENIVQAIIHAADEPVSIKRIQGVFEAGTQPDRDAVMAAIQTLEKECAGSGIELVKIGSGYRYQTRPAFSTWITRLYAVRPPRLSRALLETLAIIAYKQPVTRGDIQEVRGIAVSSDIVQRLIERGWIKKVGEKETPGRPSLYGTTPDFLGYFNLSSLKELPDVKAPRELDEIAKEMNLELPIAHEEGAEERVPDDATAAAGSDAGEDNSSASLEDADDSAQPG